MNVGIVLFIFGLFNFLLSLNKIESKKNDLNLFQIQTFFSSFGLIIVGVYFIFNELIKNI